MTVQELYEKIGGDYADACKRLMNDSLIKRFILKFPADPSFSQLKAAAEAQDSKAVFEAAHALRGVSANLAITSVAVPAGEITEAMRPGHEEQRAGFPLAQKMEELTEAYTRAVAEIDAFSKE